MFPLQLRTVISASCLGAKFANIGMCLSFYRRHWIRGNRSIFFCVELISATACRTRELSAELTVTRGYWRKQNPPVCGEILRVFRHACQKSFKILPHMGGTCSRQCSRVTVCSADNSRVRQAYQSIKMQSASRLL